MKKLALLLVLITAPLWAAIDKNVTWTPPQQRVNGDQLTSAELASYEVQCMSAGGAVIYSGTVDGMAHQHRTESVFEDGTYFCQVRVTTTDGLTSAWGRSEDFIVGRCQVSDCTPMPPTSITVSFGQ